MPKPKTPKILSLNDDRVKAAKKPKKPRVKVVKKKTAVAIPSSLMFFNYNQQLGPPFRIICDTNFINFSIKNKLDMVPAMMDCLLAKCILYVTECIIAELQKLGAKYRVALKIIKSSFEVLPCAHKGTYADDCIFNRVSCHKCYIVGTCDRALQKRIRKLTGVPIMYIKNRKYAIERMPDAPGIEPV
ncbi:rRNA-processing protein FCF1 homolog [Tetranychus urticae]|uniref:rRNA-processing protein FCF1 homolog n=1 Tax=Tetranychus urticae TaxID=32264 RepID=UPI00077B8BB2|nr:rRNA-processing protein FCF1 homolog [Tetranychus urticae]